MLLGIKWYQFVWKDDVRRLTKQPKLTAIIQSRRLTLFGHIMSMDDNADAKRILLASPPADWRRQPGHPGITWLSTVQQDLKQHHLTLPNQQISPSVEDDVDIWRYAILELHARNDDKDYSPFQHHSQWTASVAVSRWDLRSSITVFVHVLQRRLGGLFHSSREVRMQLRSWHQHCHSFVQRQNRQRCHAADG